MSASRRGRGRVRESPDRRPRDARRLGPHVSPAHLHGGATLSEAAVEALGALVHGATIDAGGPSPRPGRDPEPALKVVRKARRASPPRQSSPSRPTMGSNWSRWPRCASTTSSTTSSSRRGATDSSPCRRRPTATSCSSVRSGWRRRHGVTGPVGEGPARAILRPPRSGHAETGGRPRPPGPVHSASPRRASSAAATSRSASCACSGSVRDARTDRDSGRRHPADDRPGTPARPHPHVGCGTAGEEQDELVAPYRAATSNAFVLPGSRPPSRGGPRHRLVADAVVDLLEVVDVEDEEAEGWRAVTPAPLPFQRLVEQATVRRPRRDHGSEPLHFVEELRVAQRERCVRPPGSWRAP